MLYQGKLIILPAECDVNVGRLSENYVLIGLLIFVIIVIVRPQKGILNDEAIFKCISGTVMEQTLVNGKPSGLAGGFVLACTAVLPGNTNSVLGFTS